MHGHVFLWHRHKKDVKLEVVRGCRRTAAEVNSAEAKKGPIRHERSMERRVDKNQVQY